ncbi:putative acyltransferase [Pedobacter sp. UYP30]|uniref:acyltransferase family protein n=1 Tax=Pedobacter sp. UYP30 TaxID=1756400 RepID=UPI0033999ED4
MENFSKPKQRYLSLDVLRGLTITLMIVVNNPGDWKAIYAPFEHSAWNGFTLTDLVFPTFLFVVGNAMSFSMRNLDKKNSSHFLFKVLKRTLLIFFIGLFLNGFPYVSWVNHQIVFKNLAEIRIWGVLQRIAVCYGIASLLIYYFNSRMLLFISGFLLFGFWFIMYHFGTHPDPFSLENNASSKLDALYLSAKNIYHGFGIPFDPEGLLSTFPAVVNVMGGFFVGKFIQKNGNNISTINKLIVFGIALLIAAQVWNIVFPINKPIWTSPYVLYSIGMDLFLLAILMYIIEVLNFKKWTYFFAVFGRNPLFLYVISWIIISLVYLIRINGVPLGAVVYHSIFLNITSGKNASLLFAVTYMLLIWPIGYYLDKKKIYVKV